MQHFVIFFYTRHPLKCTALTLVIKHIYASNNKIKSYKFKFQVLINFFQTGQISFKNSILKRSTSQSNTYYIVQHRNTRSSLGSRSKLYKRQRSNRIPYCLNNTQALYTTIIILGYRAILLWLSSKILRNDFGIVRGIFLSLYAGK